MVALMGIQPVRGVTLIRHAYFATENRGKRLDRLLLHHLLQETKSDRNMGRQTGATQFIALK